MASGLFDLSGKVALVTGGNGGIGRAIAHGLADHGASVAILGRNEERNGLVLSELRARGIRAIALQADLGDRDQAQPAVDRVERELGDLDILVNNAGWGGGRPSGRLLAESLEMDIWDRVLETNLSSALVRSKYASRSMVSRRSGKIVNVITAGIGFGWQPPAYVVSKAGLEQLTKSMAFELAAHNIQVNAIAPGWTETEMTRQIREDSTRYEWSINRTPLGRWAQPEEMAGIAIFLASPASNYVTGTTIVAEGGARLS
jgi:2-deoxy-D-gluconate 3-dehydrogenase